MAQLHFSDEVLMAFADGELDETVAATVEQAIAADPAIAKRVADFLRSRRLVRSAFHEGTGTDVPPELSAAVQAQIERFEKPGSDRAPPGIRNIQRQPLPRRWHVGMALAASVAAIAVATAGYLTGRHASPSPGLGPIAFLEAPEIDRALSESPSGQEHNLPFGRMRMISTFRTASGALCREFRLHAAAGTSDAVACHDKGWKVTFAIASGVNDNAYVPSGGADPMETYLQNAGAGAPLMDGAELEALREARARK